MWEDLEHFGGSECAAGGFVVRMGEFGGFGESVCSRWLCGGCESVAEFGEGLGIESAPVNLWWMWENLAGFGGVSVQRVAMWWMCECGRNWS